MLNIILDSTFNNGCHIICLITARKTQSYHNLPEEEKNKVMSILYIMDKFSVSIPAYHELSQQEPTLPRSYLIEACQQSLDDKWDVTRTPGECPEAELPFKVLLEKEFKKMYVQRTIC